MCIRTPEQRACPEITSSHFTRLVYCATKRNIPFKRSLKQVTHICVCPSYSLPPPPTSLKVQSRSDGLKFGHLRPASNFSKADFLLLQDGEWRKCFHWSDQFADIHVDGEMNLQFPSGPYGVICLDLSISSTTSVTLDRFPHLFWCFVQNLEIKRWATRMGVRVKQDLKFLMLPAHGRQSG